MQIVQMNENDLKPLMENGLDQLMDVTLLVQLKGALMAAQIVQTKEKRLKLPMEMNSAHLMETPKVTLLV